MKIDEKDPKKTQEVFDNVQKLTNHKLKMDKDQNVTIDKKFKPSSSAKNDKEKGDKLIADIINSKQKMTIKVKDSGGNNEGDDNSANAVNGKGSDVTVNFDRNANPLISTKDPITGDVTGQTRPAQIGLGHEMIHGWRSMKGRAIDYSKTDTYTYQTSKGVTATQTSPSEEQATVGLQNRKKGDITENNLRSEQGQNPRGAY